MRKTISNCLAALAALSWTVPAMVHAEDPELKDYRLRPVGSGR